MLANTTQKNSSHEGFDSHYITYLLKSKGSSQAAVARKLKVNRASVCKVIRGDTQSRRIKRYISRITGVPYRILWGAGVRRKTSW